MNILIGKIGKSIKFKNLKINTGDDSSMILFSTMARMMSEHNFYFCAPNDFDKLTADEKHYIFPNNNVFSLFVKPDELKKKHTDKDKEAFIKNHINTATRELTESDFEGDVIFWDSLLQNVINSGIRFDFALLFTGYVGYHCMNLTCRRPDGKFYTPLNAFRRYTGPYVHLINSLNIPLYTLAEDPRYITINTEELFVRERLVLTQMTDCEVPVAQKYIKSYSDHSHIEKTPIKCVYAGVEKIFLMGIDKNWKEKIDINRKINNTTNPKCIVISNGHGTNALNSGSTVKDGRLQGYKEYIIDGLKGTEFADTHVYGLWSEEVLKKYPYTIQDKKFIELEDEIADAKYSLVYSIVPNFITIKPYEMITRGLIPFIHPDYDKNRLLNLPEYLYVSSPQDFANKMKELDEDDNKYIELLNKCFDSIKPEYLDGSYLVNNIMNKIANDLGFEYTNHKGVESIFNHFGQQVFDFDKLNK